MVDPTQYMNGTLDFSQKTRRPRPYLHIFSYDESLRDVRRKLGMVALLGETSPWESTIRSTTGSLATTARLVREQRVCDKFAKTEMLPTLLTQLLLPLELGRWLLHT